MEYVVERERDEAREGVELGARLRPAQLHAIDKDQLATSLNDLWIENQRGLKESLGEADAVTAQFDLSCEKSSLGGHEMVIGHVCQVSECFIRFFTCGRVLGPEHVVERRGRSKAAQPLQGALDAVEATRHEIRFGSRPDRVDIGGGPAEPMVRAGDAEETDHGE